MSEYTTDISGNQLIDEFHNLLVPFWADNPNVLFQSKYITEFYPDESMTYNQKLNAISRTVIFLTVASFFYTRSFRILAVGIITLGAIWILYYYHMKNAEKITGLKMKTDNDINEGFENPALEVLKKNGAGLHSRNTFDEPTSTNPLSNVLITDYEFNPKKKPAPPSFNANINESILESAKQMVIDQNPGQPDIANKLFADLGEQFVFEQSFRPFHSNPATTIPNDQAGFADFCYGSMVSCKEGNLFACARNLDRHTN